MDTKLNVALVAHDNKKTDLVAWAMTVKARLRQCQLFATGTTGNLLADALQVQVHKFKSGPLGGDQQIGAHIAEGKIDMLVFFWDPLEPLPHDPDIKALLRLAVVWNVPMACNRSTADYVFSSPLIQHGYQRQVPDFSGYSNRQLPK